MLVGGGGGDLVWGNRGSLRGDRGGRAGGFFNEGTGDTDVTRKRLETLICRRTTG
jgi:hypothetical protein